ncbi:uncharacterized protein JCM15063_005010 [Sporobolomyces koalae]|uniref:uncharacterized protein n=1 Tax=Sporobolomyces koalae TaxID=500713 RepID=UPI003175B0C5
MALLPKEMKDAWASALRTYLDWCGMEGLEDKLRFPISLMQARLFASSLAGIYRAEGVKKKLGHLRDFSLWADISKPSDGWNFNLDNLGTTFSAIASAEPHPKLTRAPLLSKHVREILSVVSLRHSLDDHFHLAMLTATIIGFTCLLRISEFTFKGAAADAEEFHRKPRGKDVVKLDNGREFNVHLPWDKLEKRGGARILIVDGFLGLMGADLLAMHLEKNEINQEDTLWSYIAETGIDRGKRVLINRTSWLNWLDARLAENNERPLHGTSIRIGGATQLILNGVDPNVVKSLGRWSEETSFYKFWRHVNVLISSRSLGVDTNDVPEEDEGDLYVLS